MENYEELGQDCRDLHPGPPENEVASRLAQLFRNERRNVFVTVQDVSYKNMFEFTVYDYSINLKTKYLHEGGSMALGKAHSSLNIFGHM
jgi:hypothetical protein